MKKIIYVFILLVGFSSVAFSKDALIGNVRVYKRSHAIIIEDCLKNLVYDDRTNMSQNWCYVDVMEENEDESLFSEKSLALTDVDFKGGKARISAEGKTNGYAIYASITNPKESLKKEDFAELLKKLLKEKGSEVSVKYFKIEK